MDKKIKEWLKIGKNNYWISKASDPLFNEDSFYKCKNLDELVEKLEHGNWCLGQAFYLNNYCFIQQVNGGDEWLVIKDDFRFESISYKPMGENGFREWFKQVRNATDKQLKNLNYKKEAI